MGIRQLDICNRVMAQAQGIAESDFPIDAFPAKVQSVILGMLRHENFKVEYLATAMLSATASALGNTYNIRVKGQWTTNAALYIIMVGRPGLGKTPPLEAVFRPLRKRDCRALEKFKAEMAAYQNTMKESKGNNGTDRPVLRRTIVSDFTPEALMLAHYNCPRGITILADEIMGMFNSANRYNNGQLIEQLLSAWSNSAIDVTRVSNPIPIHIENPCINMVGTTQTRRVHELLKKGYEDNGLLDRILFVMPKSYLVPRWTESEEEDTGSNPASAWRTWEAIMEKVFALDYDNDGDAEGNIPHLIGMEAEAKKIFFGWHNNTIERINAIRDEALVESRPMKSPVQVARLALVLQVLSYACSESHLQFVTTTAIEGAIRLNDYFEGSYRRIREYDAGRQLMVTERTVMNYLKELAKNRLIHKVRQGVYEKVSYTSVEQTEDENCNV
ncbi:MAG: DUF3987 domain-containing protein [Sanguibacteroides justesenii]|nr:DUF3987 domain-containing protein [Sanguibacteroides justesenii]